MKGLSCPDRFYKGGSTIKKPKKKAFKGVRLRKRKDLQAFSQKKKKKKIRKYREK